MVPETPRPLRIASYNIRAGLGTDLRRDPGRVLATIRALHADIVVLQEADFRLGARPAALPKDAIREQTGLSPANISDNPEGLGWHGIALLTRPDLPVTQLTRLNLPGLEPRGAIIADIPGLRLVGVHLGLLRQSRRGQLNHLNRTLDALPERPTVITGDFNEWSRKRGLGRLARHYTLLTPGRTFPSSLPVGALDRIAHCHRITARTLDIPKPEKGPHPSDHLPILAEVSALPAPQTPPIP